MATYPATNPSQFAGLYRAVNFAYGCAGPGLPGPLQVKTGTTATGAGTLTLEYGQITLPDGAVVPVLATTAPVQVGSGSNAETVTPSAVSNSTPGVNGTSTITATFANTHGIGDLVTSGTYGLQEALNYAGAQGGGQVIVDNEWASLAGSSAAAIIAAATLPSGVTIWDNRQGASFLTQSATVTLTSAQLKALHTTPVSLIAAPGSGKMIDVIDIVAVNEFLTAAYAAGGAISIGYKTDASIAATPTIAATFLTSPIASQIIKVAGVLATNLAADVLNQPLYVTCASADFTTGAGSVILKINYRVFSGL